MVNTASYGRGDFTDTGLKLCQRWFEPGHQLARRRQVVRRAVQATLHRGECSNDVLDGGDLSLRHCFDSRQLGGHTTNLLSDALQFAAECLVGRRRRTVDGQLRRQRRAVTEGTVSTGLIFLRLGAADIRIVLEVGVGTVERPGSGVRHTTGCTESRRGQVESVHQLLVVGGTGGLQLGDLRVEVVDRRLQFVGLIVHGNGGKPQLAGDVTTAADVGAVQQSRRADLL